MFRAISHKTALVGFVLATMTATGGAWARQPPAFQGLGRLSDEHRYSSAGAISADGSSVIGLSSFGEPYRWRRATGMVGLGRLPHPFEYEATPRAVSADGSVVAGRADNSDGGHKGPFSYAFYWTEAQGIVGIGPIPTDFTNSSGAHAVALNGETILVAGEFYPGLPTRQAVRWTVGDPLAEVLAPSGVAYGITPDGTVVVGLREAAGAFRWSESEGLLQLGNLPGGGSPSSFARAISADGLVVVGGSASTMSGFRPQAFLWTAQSGMVGLGDLPGGFFRSDALAVSGDGALVVGMGTVASNQNRAFIWDAQHGMRDLHDVLITEYGLDLIGWALAAATGISADGRFIVGTGINLTGEAEAFLADLGGPCPADFNADGALNSQDFFDFLAAFFAGFAAADFNRDTILNSQDFFDFLAAFFAGCP